MLSRRFYKLLVEVASRRDLRATDKLVLAVLADRIGDNNDCWPGMRGLAKDTGLRAATVVESLGRLEECGDILIDRQGTGRKNRYRLADGSATETVTPEVRQSATETVTEVRQSATETVTEALRKPKHNQTDTLNQTTARTSFAFVLRSRKRWHLPQAKLDEYEGAFPNLDVEAQLRKAAQWLVDNPGRRKTAKGMTRFLGGWLGRAKPKPEPKRGDPDWFPTDEQGDALLEEVGL